MFSQSVFETKKNRNQYEFQESKGLINKNMFYVLAIDEDNQSELNDERIKLWCDQLLNSKELQGLVKIKKRKFKISALIIN